MNLAALFSGGKDSTYAIYKAKLNDDNIKCAITIFPNSYESRFLHYPNIQITKLQTTSMKISHIFRQTNSDAVETEMHDLESLLNQAKKDFEIEGVVHGGILSEFQKNRFEIICDKLHLKMISPLWRADQKKYMKDLIDSKFKFIITSVTSEGLDDSWLGKEITIDDINRLDELSKKYGFNLSFEGGEAETLVLNCPIFSLPIRIVKSEKIWDGYRGRFEITEAILDR